MPDSTLVRSGLILPKLAAGLPVCPSGTTESRHRSGYRCRIGLQLVREGIVIYDGNGEDNLGLR